MGTNGQRVVKGALCAALGALCVTLDAAPQFAVKPYLQHPSKDAMTVICFTADKSCTATFRCWLRNGDATSRRVMTETTTGVWAQALTNNLACGDSSRKTGDLYRHRARFTGLKPNRIYDYAVELEGGNVYSNSFRTTPSRDTPIRFVAYADCETQSDPWANYVSNLAQMKLREPDFVAIPGDLVACGGVQSFWDGFWRANAGDKGEIASSIPLLTVLGNHDLYDNGKSGDSATASKHDLQGETGTERYLAYFENEPNGVHYEYRDGTNIRETRALSQLFHRVDYGPVTLIFLDSNNGDDEDPNKDTNYETRNDTTHCSPGIDRRVGGRHPDFNVGTPQYVWLTNQLADAQANSRFTFVVNHHCPWSVGPHNNSPTSTKTGSSGQPLRFLADTFIRYGVDAWICGHDEIQEHSLTNGWEELPGGGSRKHTLSIYDLGPSGDSVRKTTDMKLTNPIEYFRAAKDENSNYQNAGFLEVDVMTNRNGKWTCSLTPRYVKSNTVYAFKDQIILEEESGEIVYKEHSGDRTPAGWLEYEKPPEDRDEGGVWTEDPQFVTVTTITWNGGRMSGERQKGFATKPGLWYAWGRNDKPATKWVEGDGTPLTLPPPDAGTWDLLVTDGVK